MQADVVLRNCSDRVKEEMNSTRRIMRRGVIRTGTLLCLAAAVLISPLAGIGASHACTNGSRIAATSSAHTIPVSVSGAHSHGCRHHAPPKSEGHPCPRHEDDEPDHRHDCSVNCLCKQALPGSPTPEIPSSSITGRVADHPNPLNVALVSRGCPSHHPPPPRGRHVRDLHSSWLC